MVSFKPFLFCFLLISLVLVAESQDILSGPVRTRVVPGRTRVVTRERVVPQRRETIFDKAAGIANGILG